jgi:hypothetical protein
MEDFLRKIQLSESAIKIYLRLLDKLPRSYYELYSIVPKATPEEFDQILDELKNIGLLIQSVSQNEELIARYAILPPILPILNYYENISTNLTSIKDSIYDLMVDLVNKTFEEYKLIKLDSVLNTFNGIKKDIDEDSIIQKQEVEDIIESMEDIKNVSENLTSFHDKIKNITQSYFKDLKKNTNKIKSELVEHTKKKEMLALIEELFKKDLDLVEDFNNNFDKQFEKEFDNVSKSTKNSIDLIFQYQNDFKMLFLDMLTNFETKMNAIYGIIKDNSDNLSSAIKGLENAITTNLNNIIQNSVDEIYNLNQPIEELMKIYFQRLISHKKEILDEIWTVNSTTQINEIIQNLIVNSKESLTIIIPRIENHLALEQFKKATKNLKIRIVSSEAYTNSTVKSLKNIKNIIYKSYQNENLIILKSDSQFVMGVIQESKNRLYDFIGFGSSSESLKKLIDPIINNIWELAYSDSFHGSQITTPSKALTAVKPIISSKTSIKSERIPEKVIEKKIRPQIEMPAQIQERRKGEARPIESRKNQSISPMTSASNITDLKQRLQHKIDFVSDEKPQVKDEVVIEINNAFNNLIQNLSRLKGDGFGKELQSIADLILEKKGFSVTLHKIRSVINKFKEKLSLLDEDDKKEIIENIENWKKKLY